MVRLERSCERTAVDRLHHRRLDLDVAPSLECRPERANDLVPGDEGLPDFVVADQIQRPLAITDLHVLEPMELFRERQDALGQEVQLRGADGELASARTEHVAGHSDHVSGVEQLVEFKSLLRHLVPSHVNLDLGPALLEIGESRLALPSLGRQPSADPCRRPFRLQALAVPIVKLRSQFRDSVRRFVLVRIGLEP